MFFRPLIEGAAEDRAALTAEYRASKKVGKIHLGSTQLFYRSGLRIYYIPFRLIRRCFRRVHLVSIPMDGKKREILVEYLVVCDDRGELFEAQIPGKEAALALMDDLKRLIPDAAFGKPPAALSSAEEA